MQTVNIIYSDTVFNIGCHIKRLTKFAIIIQSDSRIFAFDIRSGTVCRMKSSEVY